MLLKIFYFFYNVRNKEKEDQNVLENKKINTYDTPLGKISMVRREIRHYTFVFQFVKVGVLNVQRCNIIFGNVRVKTNYASRK